MGPTGTPTEIAPARPCCSRRRPRQRGALLDRARAAREGRGPLLRRLQAGEDLFKQDEIEARADQVIWCTDAGARSRRAARRTRTSAATSSRRWSRTARRDRRRKSFSSSPSEAHHRDRLRPHDGAVKDARHGVLAAAPRTRSTSAIGSINSPMQCMMKEVCAQCLQRHVDPRPARSARLHLLQPGSGARRGRLRHLRERLRANSMQEKVANAWLDHVVQDVQRVEVVEVDALGGAEGSTQGGHARVIACRARACKRIDASL
jgi:hypothetical protein